MSRYQKLMGFSFFHWNIDMKRKQNKRQNKIWSSFSHLLFVHAMLLPVRAVCKAMANRKYRPRTVVLSNPGGPCCPISVLTLLPVSGSLRGTGGTGTGSQVPCCCLHRQASDEQPLAFTVSLDANVARIFFSVTLPPWHRRCQELPHILYFPLFKSHTFLKTESFNIQRKKKRAFQPPLWVHSQS